MTDQEHRLSSPRLFSSFVTKNARYHLRRHITVGIVLILIIFVLPVGQTEAIPGPFSGSAGGDGFAGQINYLSYLQDTRAIDRLYRLAWQRGMSTQVSQGGKTSSSIDLANGIIWSSYVLQTNAGPVLANLLTLDLTRLTLHLGVVQAYNRLISPDETLTSMANRSGAVAGVNGDYFEIHGSGVPIGEEVIDGQLLHSPNPHYYAVFGVTRTGRATIGPESFSGTITDGDSSYPLYSINHYSEFNNGRLLLFTTALGAPVNVGGDPVAIIQQVGPSSADFRVQAISPATGWLHILKGQEAILGSGDAGYWLAATLHKGDRIRVTGQITPDGQLFQAVGGGPQVLLNGELYDDPHAIVPDDWAILNPHTAVGITRDGMHVLLAVFDGRLSGPLRSRGISTTEVADFLLAHGAYNAMLLDSGGSSEMVARLPGHRAVSILNWPSGGQQRPLANGLFIYSESAAFALAGYRVCQARVAASAGCRRFLSG